MGYLAAAQRQQGGLLVRLLPHVHAVFTFNFDGVVFLQQRRHVGALCDFVGGLPQHLRQRQPAVGQGNIFIPQGAQQRRGRIVQVHRRGCMSRGHKTGRQHQCQQKAQKLPGKHSKPSCFLDFSPTKQAHYTTPPGKRP